MYSCKFCGSVFTKRQNRWVHEQTRCSTERAESMLDAYSPQLPRSPSPGEGTSSFPFPFQYGGSKPKIYNTQWKHPFTCMVVGPSQSGKTVFVKEFLQADRIDPPPQRILWCYSEWQPLYAKLRNVEFVDGLPDLNDLRNTTNIRKLIVADDLMSSDEATFMELATKGVHHWNCSLIFIVQDAFFNKRTTRINSNYLVLFKNPGDRLTAQNLARQSGNSRSFMEAYDAATSQPHGYLLFDRTQTCPDEIRLRTNIFPPGFEKVYAPKVNKK